MASPERVVLVDGSAMIYRAFFAIPGNFTTATGLPTNATYGFTLIFKKLFAGKTPAFGAVVFDAPGGSFRDEKYPAYKAQRPGMPSELRQQLKWIDRVVEVNRFPQLRVPGYEADDVIGTLARQAEAAGMEVHIISGDKDFCQLIGDRIKMIDSFRDLTYDAELVRKKWGVRPEKFVDYLALVGDKIDNIPGVPGIGDKGAAKLLEDYGDLEGVLAHKDELSTRYRNALVDHEAKARLSRELATIDTSVPLDVKVTDLAIEPPGQAELNALYKELEFFSLLEADEIATGFSGQGFDFRVLERGPDLAAWLDGLPDEEPTAVRVVFDDPHPQVGALLGVALSRREGEAVYVPLAGTRLADEDALHALRGFLEDEALPKVVHNAKWAFEALERAGIALRGVVFDTMLASFLVDPTKLIPHGLNAVAKEYLHRTLPPQKALTGSGKAEQHKSEVDVEKLADYACHLVEAVRAVTPLLSRRLDAEGQRRYLDEVELPLSQVLAGMERDGILADPDDLRAMGHEFRERLQGLKEQVWAMAGREFNINSTKQLSEVLFDELKLPVIKKNKTGYSTNAEVLERLAEKGHAIAEVLLEHRKLDKLINTYTDVLSQAVDPRTGRIHATFQQTVGATGRLITTDPDLQRTPVNTPEGLRIRQAFVAPPGHAIVSADWSQIELRLLAHVSQDELLVDAFQHGLDVHRRTAGQIFGKDPDAVSPTERGVGKTVNFATIYGQGATALGQQLKVPRKEAQRYIDSYFEAYRGVRAWLDETMEAAHVTGYVETLLGRRRYIPELSSNAFMERTAGERIAANTPIQGSAADICKVAMLRIHDRLVDEGLRSRMLLQIHDELVFEAPEDEVPAVQALVRTEMEQVVPLLVPLVVDVGAGPNWAAAKG